MSLDEAIGFQKGKGQRSITVWSILAQTLLNLIKSTSLDYDQSCPGSMCALLTVKSCPNKLNSALFLYRQQLDVEM